MELSTTRFGTVNISEESILTFPSGLIGFNHCTKFALLTDERGLVYQWLQSVDEGSLAFVVVQPGLVNPDYHVEVQDDALAELNFQEGDLVELFAIVTIPRGEPEKATVNLQGPIVVNFGKNMGKQIILNESYPLRYSLIQKTTASAGVGTTESPEVVNT